MSNHALVDSLMKEASKKKDLKNGEEEIHWLVEIPSRKHRSLGARNHAFLSPLFILEKLIREGLVPAMSNRILFIGLASVLPIYNVQAQPRSVTDKEAASWFETPSFPWDDLGAYIGSPQSTLAGDAIRGMMAHFDKFFPGRRHRAARVPLLEAAGL